MGPVIWMTVLLGFASLSKRNTNTVGSSNSDNILCLFVTEHFCFTASDCPPLQSCDGDDVPGKVNFSRLFSGTSSAIANNSILYLRERNILDEPEDFIEEDAGIVLNAIKQKTQDITVYDLRQSLFTANRWSRRVHSNVSQNARCWGSSMILNIMWPRDVSCLLTFSASLASEPERMASSLSLYSCYYPLEPLDLESSFQKLHDCRTYFSNPGTGGNISLWDDMTRYILSCSDNCFTTAMELGLHGHVLVSSENEEAIPTISRNISSEVIVRTIKKPGKTFTCTLYIEKHKFSFWSILFSNIVQHKRQPSCCEHYHIPDHILYTIFISCISYLLYTVSLIMVIADLLVLCAHCKTLHTKGKPLERIFILRFLSQLFFIKWNLSNKGNTSISTKVKHFQSEQSVDSCGVGKETKAQLLGEEELKKYDFLQAFYWPSARNRTDDKHKRELGAALDYKTADVHGCQYRGSSNCVSCREIITRTSKSHSSESKRDVHRNQHCRDSLFAVSGFKSDEAERYFRKVQPHMGTFFVSPAYRFLPDPTSNPAIDLVHVGYRLATLSALPSSVSVSKLRLADAGFVFKGHNDELTCYSCGKSYSGWRSGDSPFEIHRRISPECQHVLQMASDLGHNGSEESGAPGHRAYPFASDRGQAGGQQNGVDEDRRSQPVSETQSPYQLQAPSEDGEYSPKQSTAQPPIPHVQETTTSITTTLPGASSSFSSSFSSSSSSSVSARPGRQETVLASQPRSDENATSAIQSSLRTSLTSNLATSSINLSQNSITPLRVPTSASNATPSTTAVSAQTQGTDASGRRSSPARAASTAWSEDSPNDNNISSAARADRRSLFPRTGLDLGGAVYPMYQDMQSRRRTFTSWDDRKAPHLDQIILSGMFYAGYADCVRCFYCGVGLKHWLVTDDVMAEHVRWRPGCQYLRAIKGDDYIQETLNRLDLQNPANAQSEGVNNTTTATTSPSSTATSATTATTTSTSAAPASSSSSPLLSSSTSPSASTTTSTTTGASASTSSSLPVRAMSSTATARGNMSTESVEDGAINRTTVVSSAGEEAETVVQLQEENRALENRFRCRVCQEAEIDTILMPCGHLVTCETCTRSVTSCPLCHETIRATARVYLS